MYFLWAFKCFIEYLFSSSRHIHCKGNESVHFEKLKVHEPLWPWYCIDGPSCHVVAQDILSVINEGGCVTWETYIYAHINGNDKPVLFTLTYPTWCPSSLNIFNFAPVMIFIMDSIESSGLLKPTSYLKFVPGCQTHRSLPYNISATSNDDIA